MSRLAGGAAMLLACAVAVGCQGAEPSAPDVADKGSAPRAAPYAEEKMDLDRQVLAAKADLAGRLGISPQEIAVVEAREVTWPDTARGCPEPGLMYAQVLTPGVWIVLKTAEGRFSYHAAQARVPFLCPQERVTTPLEAGLPESS